MIPIVTGWLWQAFWRSDGYSLDFVHGLVEASRADAGPPQTFVLLVDGEPVGTASLVGQDLDERPDLTPWLAGVFVAPEWRGRGYVYRLIAAVEQACRDAGISTLWLYTAGAEALYARAGWRIAARFTRREEEFALMSRSVK